MNKAMSETFFKAMIIMHFGIANAELMERNCFDETFEAFLTGLIE